MLSQVMKPGSIIFSLSERLATRSGPQNTANAQVLYAIFFSDEEVAIKVPVKKHHRKVL